MTIEELEELAQLSRNAGMEVPQEEADIFEEDEDEDESDDEDDGREDEDLDDDDDE